jgi:hypothetical protein
MLADLPLADESTSVAAAGAEARDRARRAAEGVDVETRTKAYQGWLGYYVARIRGLGWNTVQLVQAANEMAVGALVGGCGNAGGVVIGYQGGGVCGYAGRERLGLPAGKGRRATCARA